MTRPLVLTQNMTLNGIVEWLQDWFDPTTQSQDLVDVMMAAGETDLLLGRSTFEDFRGFWPTYLDDTTGTRQHLDSVRKHVVSTTMTDPGWQNTDVIRTDVEGHVRALKEQPGGELGITGSIGLTHTLFRAGLIDELRLFVYPVTHYKGRNLFPTDASLTRFGLRETRGFDGGVALLHYVRE